MSGTTDDPCFEATNRHFKFLDEAFERGGTAFSTEATREGYETWVMRVFRKREACLYHLRLMKDLLAVRARVATEAFERRAGERDEPRDVRITKKVFRYSADSPEPTYELSAFLASLRSAIDHLANLTLRFYGVDGKLTELLARAKAGDVSGAGVDRFAEHRDWLEEVRDYRDALVHSYILRPNSGGERQVLDGIVAAVVYPVVVPTKTPKYESDTRRSRAAQDSSEPPPGIAVGETVATASLDGDRDRVVQLELVAVAAPGFEPIEAFAARHLERFDQLFLAVLKALEDAGFRNLRGGQQPGRK
jgi:hypothetical protein